MSRRSIRRLTTAFAAAAALLVPCAGAGTAAAADSATSPRATVTVDAPASVAAGKPITVRIGVRGARDVGGYETSLLFDQSAAHFSGARHADNSVARTGRGVAVARARGVGRGGASFGFYSCPVKDCATGKGPRHAAGASGRVALGKVTVVPDRVGRARAPLRAHRGRRHAWPDRGDPAGARRARPRRQGRRAGLPRTEARPGARRPSRAVSKNLRTVDLNRDRAVSNADAQDGGLPLDDAPLRRGAVPARPCRRRREPRRLRRRRRRPGDRRGLHEADQAHPGAAGARAAGRPDARAVLRRHAARSPRSLPANITFTVDSTADDPDANTADGICRTAANVCTLRAAIEAANARPAPTASPSTSPAPASRRSPWRAR